MKPITEPPKGQLYKNVPREESTTTLFLYHGHPLIFFCGWVSRPNIIKEDWCGAVAS